MSREKPILMSGPMVRAILAGQKTQTRRLVKKFPQRRDGMDAASLQPCLYGDGYSWQDERGNCHGCDWTVPCPYGQPGDRLWVRETWAHLKGNGIRTVYRADGEDPRTGWDDVAADARPRMKWKPGIHMRRWASRLTLEITGVRVERVQEISDADIAAEGVTAEAVRALWLAADRKTRRTSWGDDEPRWDFWMPTALWHLAWSLINGEASWNANPFVWAISFRRVEADAKAVA